MKWTLVLLVWHLFQLSSGQSNVENETTTTGETEGTQVEPRSSGLSAAWNGTDNEARVAAEAKSPNELHKKDESTNEERKTDNKPELTEAKTIHEQPTERTDEEPGNGARKKRDGTIDHIEGGDINVKPESSEEARQPNVHEESEEPSDIPKNPSVLPMPEEHAEANDSTTRDHLSTTTTKIPSKIIEEVVVEEVDDDDDDDDEEPDNLSTTTAATPPETTIEQSEVYLTRDLSTTTTDSPPKTTSEETKVSETTTHYIDRHEEPADEKRPAEAKDVPEKPESDAPKPTIQPPRNFMTRNRLISYLTEFEEKVKSVNVTLHGRNEPIVDLIRSLFEYVGRTNNITFENDLFQEKIDQLFYFADELLDVPWTSLPDRITALHSTILKTWRLDFHVMMSSGRSKALAELMKAQARYYFGKYSKILMENDQWNYEKEAPLFASLFKSKYVLKEILDGLDFFNPIRENAIIDESWKSIFGKGYKELPGET